MSEPRKINTSGASGQNGPRTVRRPESTQGRTTGQFTIPEEYRTKRPDGQSAAARSAAPRSSGEYRPAGSAYTAARANRPAGQPTGSAQPRQPGQATRHPGQAASRRPNTGSTRPAARGGAVAKRKKRTSALKIFLFTLLAIFLIAFFALQIVLHAIAPGAGSISISELINTPKEFQGDQINVLVAGVDWEEGRAYGTNDSNTNDGMTDMILYMHFDLQNHKISMLQIPRNTLVAGVYNSGNGQINSVALTNNGIADLAECINKMFGLPVDDYIAIDMASLKQIVDTFGGVEVYVPHDMEYAGSMLRQGYQTMDGDAAEFFVRCRKGQGYERSDLDRLNMQRYFYSALFRRVRTCTLRDVAKLTPVAMNYVTTSLSATEIASLGVSFLKVDSANIMICQLPVHNSPEYYLGTHSVVVAAKQESADLLNTYFRTYTGPMDVSQLNLPDWSISGEASDPNVQFMGQLDTQAEAAQQNNNLDGSFTVVTNTPAEDEEQTEETAK